MALYSLENHRLALTVSPCGGTILQLLAKRADDNVPLLRPSVLSEDTPAAESACFPLLPFGNRLKGNAFDFEGRHYTLPPNTGDAHYLHGDGWLGNWQCVFQSEVALTLAFTHRSDSYCYRAEQHFSLHDNRLDISLCITNQGLILCLSGWDGTRFSRSAKPPVFRQQRPVTGRKTRSGWRANTITSCLPVWISARLSPFPATG